MAGCKRLQVLLALLGVLGVTGCAPLLDEPRQYHWNQEWAQLKTYWPNSQNRRTMAQLFKSMPNEGCQLLPVERRSTVQEGVSDRADYTQCWQTPYGTGPTASGQRLRNRPETLN